MASRAGKVDGCPRAANWPAISSSMQTSPSASRIRIAGDPFENAARATCSVNAETS
ncbi:hypothetical protein ACIQU6_42030 [Streptomyces sp. NPDC090442]|uniref:hypothetical protein n=1 Tax=Streptomyces sp. NPDC090442 TaxID=3365962 RepID=UPI00380407DD